MASGGTRAILAAMIANAGIAVAKFVAYLVTGSSAMLAESVHSVADTSNQGLLLLGGRQARRIADDEHQFGYGRERYFWSFVVALVLFTLGGVYSLYEGIDKLRHPHEVTSLGWAIGVLIFSLILEGFSFRTAIVEARKEKGNRGWWDYIRSSRSPELPVVLLEDAGAMLGLMIALIGVSLTAATGDPVWDGLATVGIGLLLLVIASVLTVEMRSLLLGEAATKENIAAILSAVRGSDGVKRIIDLRTQHIGPEELLVAGKVEFDRSLTMSGVADAIDRCEIAIRQAVPYARRIYLEPDIFDPDHVGTADLPPEGKGDH
ncbi:MAG: cation diffusion facilitator family transporter [Acidimicrobiia bacterium]